ncbi:MAG: caspase family protein [Halobacteriota archaeon]
MTKRLALIIGVDQYKEGLDALPGARNDSEELYDRLKGDSEFEYEIPEPLIGSQATSQAIREALSKYFWHPKDACELALFYFSGHGEHDAEYEEGYIAPYDMKPESPIVFGIKMNELVRIISNSPHTNTITVLDCCYSGWAAEGARGMRPDATEEFKVQADAFGRKEGRYVLASSAKDQPSKERCVSDETNKRHYHGALTSYLLEGLDKGNEDGIVTYHDLSVYVDNKLRENTTQCCTGIGSGPPQSGDIEITRLNELRYAEELGPLIEKAELRLSQKNPFFAAVAISRGLKICKSRRLSVLEETCNTCLKNAQPAMDAFITENSDEDWFLPRLLKPLRLWTSDFMDYDHIVQLHDRDKNGWNVLYKLYLLSIGEIADGSELERAGNRYKPTLQLTPKVVRVSGPTGAQAR